MSKNNVVKSSVRPEEVIQQKIFIIRGQKVMLDKDLADLYETPTGNINRAIKRNIDRFPSDFMFQLSKEEFENLICQTGISSSGYGGSRHLPYVFTEHGVAMLSSVLNTERAVQMNIFIIRAFIKMRQSLDNYKDLALKIAELEQRQLNDHGMLNEVYMAVKQLLQQKIEPKEKIGFRQK